MTLTQCTRAVNNLRIGTLTFFITSRGTENIDSAAAPNIIQEEQHAIYAAERGKN